MQRDLRRAALLHDVGKLAISNRILDKPAPLTSSSLPDPRAPLITERILARVPGCAHIASIASAHHERLDRGGYPGGLSAAELTMPMRLLAEESGALERPDERQAARFIEAVPQPRRPLARPAGRS